MKARLLSPLKCIFCGFHACSDKFPVCRRCLPIINSLVTEKCKNCGKTPKDCKCSTKSNFVFFFESHDSKRLLYHFKYNSDKRIMKFMAEWAVTACGIEPQKFDGVTFVPRALRRKMRYGYDQSKEFAKAISEIYGIPFVTSLKRKGNRVQKLLSRDQRIKNIKNKFKVKSVPEEKYKHLLLVDDVTTTGATLEVCASILKENNVTENVTLLSLAKTVTKQKNNRREK